MKFYYTSVSVAMITILLPVVLWADNTAIDDNTPQPFLDFTDNPAYVDVTPVEKEVVMDFMKDYDYAEMRASSKLDRAELHLREQQVNEVKSAQQSIDSWQPTLSVDSAILNKFQNDLVNYENTVLSIDVRSQWNEKGEFEFQARLRKIRYEECMKVCEEAKQELKTEREFIRAAIDAYDRASLIKLFGGSATVSWEFVKLLATHVTEGVIVDKMLDAVIEYPQIDCAAIAAGKTTYTDELRF